MDIYIILICIVKSSSGRAISAEGPVEHHDVE